MYIIPVKKDNLSLLDAVFMREDRDDILNEEGTVFAFGAIEDHMAAGFVIFEIYNETVYVRRIYVSPGMRRIGIGTRLLNTVCELADQQNIDVAGSILIANKILNDSPAYEFFIKNNFVFQRNQLERYFFTLGEVKKCKWRKVKQSQNVKLITFKELNQGQVAHFYTKTKKTKYPYLSVNFEKGAFLDGLSVAAVKRDEVVSAAIVEQAATEICISYLYAESQNIKDLVTVLDRIVTIAAEKLPDDLRIHIMIVDETTRKILRTLTPFARKELTGYTMMRAKGEV